jgi:hypothetical protein
MPGQRQSYMKKKENAARAAASTGPSAMLRAAFNIPKKASDTKTKTATKNAEAKAEASSKPVALLRFLKSVKDRHASYATVYSWWAEVMKPFTDAPSARKRRDALQNVSITYFGANSQAVYDGIKNLFRNRKLYTAGSTRGVRVLSPQGRRVNNILRSVSAAMQRFSAKVIDCGENKAYNRTTGRCVAPKTGLSRTGRCVGKVVKGGGSPRCVKGASPKLLPLRVTIPSMGWSFETDIAAAYKAAVTARQKQVDALVADTKTTLHRAVDDTLKLRQSMNLPTNGSAPALKKAADAVVDAVVSGSNTNATAYAAAVDGLKRVPGTPAIKLASFPTDLRALRDEHEALNARDLAMVGEAETLRLRLRDAKIPRGEVQKPAWLVDLSGIRVLDLLGATRDVVEPLLQSASNTIKNQRQNRLKTNNVNANNAKSTTSNNSNVKSTTNSKSVAISNSNIESPRVSSQTAEPMRRRLFTELQRSVAQVRKLKAQLRKTKQKAKKKALERDIAQETLRQKTLRDSLVKVAQILAFARARARRGARGQPSQKTTSQKNNQVPNRYNAVPVGVTYPGMPSTKKNTNRPRAPTRYTNTRQVVINTGDMSVPAPPFGYVPLTSRVPAGGFTYAPPQIVGGKSGGSAPYAGYAGATATGALVGTVAALAAKRGSQRGRTSSRQSSRSFRERNESVGNYNPRGPGLKINLKNYNSN